MSEVPLYLPELIVSSELNRPIHLDGHAWQRISVRLNATSHVRHGVSCLR